MAGFSRIALLHSHPRLPVLHDYHLSDLIELCGLAACVHDRVDAVHIPVTPVDRDPLGSFQRFMARQRPELVGISCFTSGAISAEAYAAIAKRHGAYVVLGGYHPSALPEAVLASPNIDAVVRGEGELTLQELVDAGSPEGIAGMSYRVDGTVVHNPERPLIEDLDTLPLPLRELRPPRFGLAGLDYHTDTVFASRGCKGRCSFCANHLVGKTWRRRSNQRILAELLSIPPPRKGPWKVVKFWDSNFLTDADRIDRLCDLILEHGLERHLRFMAETRIEDVIRCREILPKMRRAGFVRIGCGIESPNRETLKRLRKGINLGFVEQAAELLRSASIMFSKFLIVGHDGESAEDILRYPEYALSHGVELQNTTFFVMTPYPGTALAEDLRSRGLVKSDCWDLYTNLGAVIAPSGLEPLELQSLHSTVLADYGMARRFLLGKRFSAVATKLLEALFIHSAVCLAGGSLGHREIEDSLWQALVRISGKREREHRQRRRRFLDRAVLHLHCRDREPVLAGVVQRGDREVLIVGRRSEVGDELAGLRPLHLSLARLITAVDRLDLRRLASDGLSCYWNPKAFKLRWLPTFAWDLAKLLTTLAGMAVFHLRCSMSRR